jgi:hypothetical protein
MATLSLPPSHCLAFAMPVGLAAPPFARDGNCLGFGLGFFIRRAWSVSAPASLSRGRSHGVPGSIFSHSFGNACKQVTNDGVKSLQSLSLRLMSQSTTEGREACSTISGKIVQ